ncbi:probable ABC1 transport protein [Phialocephala subalpina]|uniref:Probable ABC1 transport protein n=1 Tax=Phialocephala subalpina TaxID=576137 RepID=A0A1L7XV13_9HELO|nr:probable ABC1 transport protein [Phialocephala subalpina]
MPLLGAQIPAPADRRNKTNPIAGNSEQDSLSSQQDTGIQRPPNSDQRADVGANRESQTSKITSFAHTGTLEPNLDPSRPNFDFEQWSRAIINLRAELGIPSPPRSGVLFKDLTVCGSNQEIKLQETIWTTMTSPFRLCRLHRKKQSRTIIRGFYGVVSKGELLLVLGRPGSGCTTFLKTITGEMQDLELAPQSVIHYNGIPQKVMTSQFKGELVYNQEWDEHFPHLTVGQTLEFAAAARTPRTRLPKVTRADRIKQLVEVVMKVFGLSHACNTIVGNDYIRGVSGGERKRVSIAEMAISGAAISAWDNSTRGLDAATSLGFVRSLAILSALTQSSNAVAIYQASQAIFDQFNKLTVIYDGRQIYFGRPADANDYFEKMGWYRPPRQTAGDFITGVTNPTQRVAKEGFENRVPRTSEEFEQYWHASSYFSSLKANVDQLDQEFTQTGHQALRGFEEMRRKMKMKYMRTKAAETISFPMQTWLCMKRSYQRLWNDKTSTLTTLVGEVIIALVVGSIFYGTPATTDAFFAYGSVIFFSVLLNVLMSVTDIYNLYSGRSIIRKHVSYAFYRPSADALAGILIDIPIKFFVAVFFNVTLYFLAGLSLTASQFFIFFVFVFVTTLAMSMIFRTIAAVTATLAKAMGVSGFLVLALVTYTGFVLPRPYMHPWFKWISYINPLSYAFEALLVNQAHGVNYTCTELVPPYQGLTGDTFICQVPGAVVGQTYVVGDAWFETNYNYSYLHVWRNLGILFGFIFFFLAIYLLAAELNVGTSTHSNILAFSNSHNQSQLADNSGKIKRKADLESPSATGPVAEMGSERDAMPFPAKRETLAWQDVSLDIEMKGEPRRLLDKVSGWVKPGTITALMGVSGAGKTTLLNVLSQRPTGGITRGEFYVDGKPLTASFKSDIGYVQQQDIHLETSTVREALRFSAVLRQPKSVPMNERFAFVEDIIRLLDMEDFGDAVIGRPDEGLNAEQRKRVSIGVELAAKPTLLVFLDEPTSGLDSQSSQAIISLLRGLAKNGLAILCTIHQPSSMLFQEFDRVLLLARGGRTVYFGDIGRASETLLHYFQSHGARRCAAEENPAEYALEVIGRDNHDGNAEGLPWASVWIESAEADEVSRQLGRMTENRASENPESHGSVQCQDNHRAYPTPTLLQIPPVCRRVFQQYWRSPTYIMSKFALGIAASLFIGFSFFQPGLSILGVQNAIFGIVMLCATFSSLVQQPGEFIDTIFQIMPQFLIQRSLYEARERYSNTYSWAVLVFANILAEIPYHIILGIVTFAIFNYTVFGIRSSEEQGIVLLLFIYFYIFAGTFAQMLIAALPNATTAGRVSTILFSMMILFAGVFQIPTALPGFWIFMYRVSPMTYLLRGIAVAGLSGNPIVCSTAELAVFQPPMGETCGNYLEPYLLEGAPGTLLNPSATSDCAYCPLIYADQLLARSNMYYNQRWMDWALGFAYVGFNIACIFTLYYLFRVRIWGRWLMELSEWTKHKKEQNLEE